MSKGLPVEHTGFGEVRGMIVATMKELRDGSMPVERGMAIAANAKVLNDNVQVEVNAVKVMMLARREGHDFGRIVKMGRAVINDSSEDPDEGPQAPPRIAAV